MKVIPAIPSMRPEPPRDRYGRYILDGRPYTRQTTVAHTLDDTHALTQWKRRMVLQGVATNPVLLRDVPNLVREVEYAGHWREAKDAKAAIDALCDDAARAAGAEDGSKLGTLLHTVTEYADAGRFPEIEHLVPEELLDDLAAYLVTMRQAGIECPPEYIERILINDELEAAGTTDRFLVMPFPCRTCGGTIKIGDLKTQKSVDFGWLSIAIQLAGYAYADHLVDPDTGEPGPMPEGLCRCSGIVMHLPVASGVCTLYEINLVEGWVYAQLAVRARSARSASKHLGWKYAYEPRVPADVRDLPQPVADIAPVQASYLVRNAEHPDALAALWRDLSAAGQWTDRLTELAKIRKAELTREAA